jgi:small basic protein
MSILTKITALLSKEGKTPLGKAVEHAVVAGVAVGLSLLLKDASTGNVGLSDLSVAAVTAGSAIIAGLRAALKASLKSAVS